MGFSSPTLGKLMATLMAGFLLGSLQFVSAATASEKLVAVVGAGECSDCAAKNINPAAAFNGLNVAVYCKTGKGMFQIRGVGKLDEEGKFSVKLPADVVGEDGGMKTKCYAQLHGGPKNAPCPAAAGASPEAASLVVQSAEEGKHAFATAGKLSFTSDTCTSAFFFWYKPIPKFPWDCPPKYSESPPEYAAPSPPTYSSPSPPY